jgi:hypothetical protein
MNASRVSVHSWEGSRRFDFMVVDPDLVAVEAAVKRLDANHTSEAIIEAKDGNCLILGGGSGRYVGFVSLGEEAIHNLVNPKGSPDHTVELCAGGQLGIYAESQLVDLHTALLAARAFAEWGVLEESLTWEPQR